MIVHHVMIELFEILPIAPIFIDSLYRLLIEHYQIQLMSQKRHSNKFSRKSKAEMQKPNSNKFGETCRILAKFDLFFIALFHWNYMYIQLQEVIRKAYFPRKSFVRVHFFTGTFYLIFKISCSHSSSHYFSYEILTQRQICQIDTFLRFISHST